MQLFVFKLMTGSLTLDNISRRHPQGISRGHAEYLFMEIREFWRDGTEDLVAPQVTEL